MEVRIKYTNYDQNEYKSVGRLSLNQTIGLFKSFPWEKELGKIENIKEQISYPIVKIIKPNREYLEINGFKRNGVIFFNVNLKFKKTFWKSITALQKTETETLELLKIYYENSIDKLISLIKTERYTANQGILYFFINNSREKDKLVQINPEKPRFYKYYFKFSKALLKSLFSFIFLAMPTAFYLFGLLKGWDVSLKDMMIFQIPVTLFALPGIVLLINHTIKSRNLKIYFQKNDNNFIFISNGTKEIYIKNEIERIKQYQANASSRAPWSDFKYWEIIMNSGKSIKITDILIDEIDFLKRFGYSQIEKEIKKKFLPLL